ncbi:MAG: tetratricopeptide repeat protein, partial [Deltaproteobacteria bacterium]|nr:tetratricopeptide repeat protein [Deltaproteobacteria bacterium]
ALMNIGRCYEAVGNREKACQAYREYVENFSAGASGDLARMKITIVCDS